MTGSRTRVAALLLLVFAAGAAAGVAADRLDLLPDTARAEEATTDSDEDEGRERRETTIERFADELGLTGEQRARIEEILEDFRGGVKSLRAEFHPRWHALIDTTRTRIEAVLTPEQVSQYRTLLEREREERRDDDDGERRSKGGEEREDAGSKRDGGGGTEGRDGGDL